MLAFFDPEQLKHEPKFSLFSGFNAISKKALVASGEAKLPRSYWDWQDMLNANKQGVFPYTPATNLLYGLRESIRMLLEEGLDQVFSRHC